MFVIYQIEHRKIFANQVLHIMTSSNRYQNCINTINSTFIFIFWDVNRTCIKYSIRKKHLETADFKVWKTLDINETTEVICTQDLNYLESTEYL